jgi:hypothetical protein
LIQEVEYNEKKEKVNGQKLSKSFLIYPKITFLLVNLTLSTLLVIGGLFLLIIIKTYSFKYYGEHCSTANECSSYDNLICLDGLCTCKSNYYFKSSLQTCGK